MSQFINKREKDELLIELVKSNRSIYDASDKNYKNNIEKDKCWEKISEMIEMSVSECKKRWKSLRDQYNKKKKDYGTGSARVDTSWEYGTLMSFLSDSVHDRRETKTSQSACQQISSPMQENIQDDTQNNGQEVTQDEIQEDIQHSFDDTHKKMQENTQRQMQKKDNAEQQRPSKHQNPKK
ncbi:unnamed protein product [Acanthoscelides obtectus]|uniref:MADF domain-containing protein n=1 Tax=Acanthoscelides obtectus TaxID=200917 RepID=A0A9P0KKQ1_ACAOB|nr:unnamed protein product [Acanthoscelides obtectus]CAK1651075.1 Transcription factor Adf-1 [Acanthoscelides obtectus]